MKKKKETYKTNHPTIKEITIGDKFVCDNGKIVELITYDNEDSYWPFETNLGWYTSNLKFLNNNDDDPFDIKQKIPSLKDKIDLL